MNERSIRRFLIELGVDHNSLISERGWVNCPCPLAPYVHESGADQRPSFGITVNDEGPSYYYCFGCTPEGRGLQWLIHNFFIMDGEYPKDAAQVFLHEEIHDPEEEHDTEGYHDPWGGIENDPVEITPIPYSVLKKFPMLQYSRGFEARKIREYLVHERGIPLWAAHMLKVRIDPNSSTIVFPLTDQDRDIYTLRARSRRTKKMWTISATRAGVPDMKFSDIKDTGAMFGLWHLDMRKPVMIVEGELDVLKVISFGFDNVVASSTSSIANAQIESISSRSILMGFDNDKAGDFAVRRVRDTVGSKAMLFRLNWNMVLNKKGEACKDPGDLMSVSDFQLVLKKAEPCS